MTTLELLDALEAGVAALRSQNGHAAPGGPASMAPAALRALMEKSALSVGELAGAMGVPRDEIGAWLDGSDPVPSWVPAAFRILALLTPSARRALVNGAASAAQQRTARSHPFARIEEL